MIETIDLGKCNGCGQCIVSCPMDVLWEEEGKPYIRFQEDCMCCFNCELYCRKDAVYVSPRRPDWVRLPW